MLIFFGQYILYSYPREYGLGKFETGATFVSIYNGEDADIMDCLANIVRIRNNIIHYDKVKLIKNIEDVKQRIEYLMNNYDNEFIKSKIKLLIDYGFDKIKHDCCEIDFNKYNNTDEDSDDYVFIDVVNLMYVDDC